MQISIQGELTHTCTRNDLKANVDVCPCADEGICRPPQNQVCTTQVCITTQSNLWHHTTKSVPRQNQVCTTTKSSLYHHKTVPVQNQVCTTAKLNMYHLLFGRVKHANGSLDRQQRATRIHSMSGGRVRITRLMQTCTEECTRTHTHTHRHT